MPRNRNHKPNIKPQIIKALYVSTKNDPTVTVSLSSIVKQAIHQINGLANFPGTLVSKERLIKTTIYKMRDSHEIGYEGRNKYTLGRAFHGLPQFKVDKMEKVPPEYFKVQPQKRLAETSTALDPARKRRRSSEQSLGSLSGDKFENTLKQFHGVKKIERHDFNPNLPKTRQVEITEIKSWQVTVPEIPSTSGHGNHSDTDVLLLKTASDDKFDNNDSSNNADDENADSNSTDENGNEKKEAYVDSDNANDYYVEEADSSNDELDSINVDEPNGSRSVDDLFSDCDYPI